MTFITSALGKQAEALYVGSVALKSTSLACVSAIGPWHLGVVEEVPLNDCLSVMICMGSTCLWAPGDAVADALATRRVHWSLGLRRMSVALEVIDKEGDWLEGVSIARSVQSSCSMSSARVVGPLLVLLAGTSFVRRSLDTSISCTSWQCTRSECLVSEYYAYGADRLSQDACCSIVARSSDGRLARQYESVCIEMVTEFDTIEQIPVFVWSALASAVGVKAFVLRDH
eukprot:5453969-Amphidinium_carterae.2